MGRSGSWVNYVDKIGTLILLLDLKQYSRTNIQWYLWLVGKGASITVSEYLFVFVFFVVNRCFSQPVHVLHK